MLRERLAQASPEAQEIAGLAAAVGTNFSLDLLTEASDLAADGVVAAVDELWRSRILREFGNGYDFSHDLLRDAAYAEVTPARRWLLHRRVAQGLELLHADDIDAAAALLAAQYARAGGQAKAVAFYRRAGQVATGRFAHAEAARLYREALAVIQAMPGGGTGTTWNWRSAPRSPRRSPPGKATRRAPWSGTCSARPRWPSRSAGAASCSRP